MHYIYIYIYLSIYLSILTPTQHGLGTEMIDDCCEYVLPHMEVS